MIFDKNNDGQLQYSEFLAIMNDRVNRGFKVIYFVHSSYNSNSRTKPEKCLEPAGKPSNGACSKKSLSTSCISSIIKHSIIIECT